MLKKKVWIVVAVVALVVGIFGWDTAVGYLKGARDSIKKTVSDNTPTSMDVSRIEALIKDEVENIGEFEDELAALDDKIQGENEKIARIDKEVEDQTDGLRVARELIGQNKKVYFAGGRNRSFGEIEADASARVKYIASLTAQRELCVSLTDQLTKTSRNCQASLSTARKNILAKQIELEQMKAREMNAEIQARAAALSQSLIGMSDSILNHSELQEAMKVYEGKIAKKERQAGRVAQTNSPWIDYSEPKDDTTPTLINEIDRVLASDTKK